MNQHLRVLPIHDSDVLLVFVTDSIHTMADHAADGCATHGTPRTTARQDCTGYPANRCASSGILLTCTHA
jgi:hypothetical protein